MKTIKVYIHRNLINNKVYIGITGQELNRRFRNGEGYKKCPRFYNAIKKYGWNNFEHKILLETTDIKIAEEMEIESIKKYKSRDPEFGYNLQVGGNKKRTGIPPWNKGKKIGPLKKEHREKIRNSLIGVKRPFKKRSPLSEECKSKISVSNTGKKRSESTNEKNRIAHLGLKQSDSAKTKKSETMINKYPKPVIGTAIDNSRDVLVFISPKMAANYFNLKNSSSIINVCKGRSKSCKNYTWKYISLEEYNNFKSEDIV